MHHLNGIKLQIFGPKSTINQPVKIYGFEFLNDITNTAISKQSESKCPLDNTVFNRSIRTIDVCVCVCLFVWVCVGLLAFDGIR